MSDPVYIYVRLPLKIGPIDRDELWEEPLTEVLAKDGPGEVTGGGTMMSPEGDILYCDIEIALDDQAADTLDKLQTAVVGLGAPKGTTLVNDDGDVLRSFGDLSVVGVGLDGTGLPDSAYEDFDPDEFDAAIQKALGVGCSYGGSEQGERYTFFYYHGPDAKHIEDALRKLVGAMPIGQGAQFTQLV